MAVAARNSDAGVRHFYAVDLLELCAALVSLHFFIFAHSGDHHGREVEKIRTGAVALGTGLNFFFAGFSQRIDAAQPDGKREPDRISTIDPFVESFDPFFGFAQ